MNKTHMKECTKPHTMVHSLFGLGIGLIIAGLLQFSPMTGVILGLVVMAIAFALDYRMGMKK